MHKKRLTGILLPFVLAASLAACAAEEDPGARHALTTPDYAVISVYLAALILIGAYFSRKEPNTESYFLGGRRVPWWAVGLSLFGTSCSAITYLSIPATACSTNWVFMPANLAILICAPIVVAFYLKPFRAAPIQTAYEYLEFRFNLATRLYGSACFLAFQIGRIGIVMLLPAIALSTTTGLDKYACILIMGVLATIYTVLGGIEAVIWTDVVQSFVLVLGAIAALVLVTWRVDGGLPEIVTSAWDAGKFHIADWNWDVTTASIWVVIVGNVFSNMYPATADQTVVQRYLSTPDARRAARAVWTNAVIAIPITLLFFSLGTALWAYFQQHPERMNPSLPKDAVLPLFVALEFPGGLRGLLIAGVFAAAMSSLDSSINSISSVLVNDGYRRWRPNVSESSALRLARWTTLIFGAFGTIAALYVASLDTTTLWDMFLRYLGLVGGGLAGVFALGVFTQRANGPGAVIGAATSAVVLYFAQRTTVHYFLYGMIAFVTAFVIGYAASLALPGRRKVNRE